jgi:predicted small secreted protein
MLTSQRICSILLLASTVLAATGCSTVGRDRRDAPWDPKPGHSLIDVLPNWDHAPCRPQSDPDCPKKTRPRHQ